MMKQSSEQKGESAIPQFLYQLALIIIVIRCVIVLLGMIQTSKRAWLDVFFHASVAVVALHFLLY